MSRFLTYKKQPKLKEYCVQIKTCGKLNLKTE